MNRTERGELRSLIRMQLKVLRSDIEARRAELYGDIDRALEAEYEADMQRWDGITFQVAEAVREANRKANDLYREFFGRETWGEKTDRTVVQAIEVSSPKRERQQERLRRRNQVDATVAKAQTELDRKEAELYRELTIGALESTEAKEFLARIPTVSELVPASRLAELTASITDEDDRR